MNKNLIEHMKEIQDVFYECHDKELARELKRDLDNFLIHDPQTTMAEMFLYLLGITVSFAVYI